MKTKEGLWDRDGWIWDRDVMIIWGRKGLDWRYWDYKLDFERYPLVNGVLFWEN